MEENTTILELRDIDKVFPGVKALDKMNLQVKKGTVHMICGENGAGKSCLMKIINGSYKADGGEVVLRGKTISNYTVRDTMDMGIAMIYQELNPVMEMTIAENIFLGREPRKGKLVDFKKMNKMAEEVLKSLNSSHKPTMKMKSLSIAGQQEVEIAKALSMKAEIIIMDEPTSSLTNKEVDVLFEKINQMRDSGMAVLYITHRMEEIFRIADEVTIIRDGKYIDNGTIDKFDMDKIVSLMVGRSLDNVYPPAEEGLEFGDVVLKVEKLTQSKVDGGRFDDINFEVKAGEILGFAGLVGAGRSEVMKAIFGLDPLTSGNIYMNNEEIKISSTKDAVKNGIAMISEDRRSYGLVLGRSVYENITLVNADKYVKKLLISEQDAIKESNELVDKLRIKIANLQVMAETLSGGNQQKVVLAKWLSGDVKVIIMDEPTRGIDIGAKYEIYKLMRSLAKSGMAVIMISSEMPEIMGMSDRIIVMNEGRITGSIDKEEASQEKVMKMALS